MLATERPVSVTDHVTDHDSYGLQDALVDALVDPLLEDGEAVQMSSWRPDFMVRMQSSPAVREFSAALDVGPTTVSTPKGQPSAPPQRQKAARIDPSMLRGGH